MLSNSTDKPVYSKVIEIIILATLYVVTARIGQVLAIPPGNVTPVWIPSGIILAAILLRGNYLWPGIFIGAFVGNAWAYFDFETYSNIGTTALSGFSNGVGDSLCAIVSATFIRQKVKSLNLFSDVKSIVSFIYYGALIGSAISAIFGVGGLAITGIISWSSYINTWLTWWVGDAIGIIFITPILLQWRSWADWSWVSFVTLLELCALFLTFVAVSSLALGVIQIKGAVNIPLFALLPVAIWSVYRFKLHISLFLVLCIAIFTILATTLGYGPFIGKELNQGLIELHLFLFTISVTIYILLANLLQQNKILRSLAKNVEYSRNLFNRAAEGIITTDKTGIVTSFNYAAESIFGYSSTDIIGKNISLLVNPEHRNNHDSYLSGYHKTKKSKIIGIGREVLGLHKNGDTLELSIAISESKYGDELHFLAMVHDISDIKSERRYLEEREQYFHFLANSSFEAIAIHDKGFLLHANNRFFEIFQYEPSELLNKQIMPLLIKPESIERSTQYILEGRTEPYEIECLKKDGSIFTAEVLARQDTFEGSPVRTTAIRDISEFKKQQKHLSNAKEVAEKANRAKSEFITSMSHELRTPLNAIIGFSQLIELENIDSSTTENSIEILNAGKHLLDLINDILDLSLIEAEKLNLSFEVFNVSELIDKCITLTKNMAKSNDVTTNFISDKTQGGYVKADKVRLKQVILNLLSNSIKYNRSGGSVMVTTNSVIDDEVSIQITDTGLGISKSQLEDLFQPFERLGRELGTIQGTGIGLVIAQQLIQKMNGNIQVQSKEGIGSTFSINLPRQSQNNEGQQSPNSIAELQSNAPTKNIKVLYIEDNAANRKLMSKILKTKVNIALSLVETAEKAITYLESNMPDIILLDINLPGMNGYELMKYIQNDNQLKNIPVIAVTANAMVNDVEKAQQYGFASYLTKPLMVNELFEALDIIKSETQKTN